MTNLSTSYISNLNTKIGEINIEALKTTLKTPVSTSTSTLDSKGMTDSLGDVRKAIDAIGAKFDSVELKTYLSTAGGSIDSLSSELGSGKVAPDLLDRIVKALSGISLDTITNKAKGSTVPESVSKLNYDSSAASYYRNVFNEIKESGGCNAQNKQNMNSADWLYAQLSTGNISLSEKDNSGDFVRISWASEDSTLAIETDDKDVAKAEANYNAVIAEIKTKDSKFDLELKDIDTEHSAIQTEIDSVKKVIDKNIERSFKLFNG